MSALNETRHTHLRFVGFVHSVSFTSFHSLLLPLLRSVLVVGAFVNSHAPQHKLNEEEEREVRYGRVNKGKRVTRPYTLSLPFSPSHHHNTVN